MQTLLEPRARRAPIAHSPRHTALSPSVVAVVDAALEVVERIRDGSDSSRPRSSAAVWKGTET